YPLGRDGSAPDLLRLDLRCVRALVAPLIDCAVYDDRPLRFARNRIQRVRAGLHVDPRDRNGRRDMEDRRLVRAGPPEATVRHVLAADHGAAPRARAAVAHQDLAVTDREARGIVGARPARRIALRLAGQLVGALHRPRERRGLRTFARLRLVGLLAAAGEQ